MIDMLMMKMFVLFFYCLGFYGEPSASRAFPPEVKSFYNVAKLRSIFD